MSYYLFGESGLVVWLPNFNLVSKSPRKRSDIQRLFQLLAFDLLGDSVTEEVGVVRGVVHFFGLLVELEVFVVCFLWVVRAHERVGYCRCDVLHVVRVLLNCLLHFTHASLQEVVELSHLF